jgi:DNA-directed RNA polymerase subunit E'/Rpb7
MDPLFERRELTKKVHIFSKFLQKNMVGVILAQLKMNTEGKCSGEGFIGRDSISIIAYSLGRTNYVKGGVDYDVTFQADVCMPHPGQIFRAPLTLRSKVGIHAETPPIKILIPRDLHLGNAEFDDAKVGEEIEFEVVGSQFKQKDTEIIVVGKLRSRADDAPRVRSSEEEAPKSVVVSAEPQGEEKRVVVTQSEPALVIGKPKRKLLKGGLDIIA